MLELTEKVLSNEGARDFLKRPNRHFGRAPIELLKEDKWDTLYKEIMAMAEGVPL